MNPRFGAPARRRSASRRCRRSSITAIVAVAAVLLGACGSSSTGSSERLTTATDLPQLLSGVTGVTKVSQLTGPDSPNRTDRFRVAGTDLGSMFRMDGKTWFVFGDTFGSRAEGLTGGGGEEWRSNALAYTSDIDPTDGILLDGFVTDEQGWASEPVPGLKVDYDEMTIIPTYGFAVGGTMYLAFMSVKHWGDPGEWETNHSGLAKSTDQGKTWTKLESPRWPGDSNFVQVSVTEIEGELYFWGVTHGRFGGVQLMKVPTGDVEKQDAYRYFTGTTDGSPNWSADMAQATTIVTGTVGELSVMWSDYLDRWIMTSTDGGGAGTQIREAAAPWGTWSDPMTLVSSTDVPGLYAPYLLPEYTTDGGRTIYFTLSVWDPYQVFWYRADLVKKS